jgi:hypothetical protein
MVPRSATQTPIISGVEPQGRPGTAAAGLGIMLAGLLALGLVGSGVLPLTAASGPTAAIGNPFAPTATVTGLTPTGQQPAGFAPYSDSQGRFALFLSTTWAGKAGTIPVSGQAAPAVIFMPKPTNQPSWQIAFPASAFPSSGLAYIQALTAIITAQGGSGVTPVQGPAIITAGRYQWSRLDVTAQLKSGLAVRVAAFTQMLPSGQSVLIIATAQTFTFSTVEQQDFMPMLTSLFLKG